MATHEGSGALWGCSW